MFAFMILFGHQILNTVGAISLERREKFRAQIQSLLLSFMVKLESCALEQHYRDTCWGGGGTVFHHLNLNSQSAASFCPERYFLRSVAARKILSSTKMVKKKEVSIDAKLKIHIWTEAGIKPPRSLHAWDVGSRQSAV
jgi:hypothetical protein